MGCIFAAAIFFSAAGANGQTDDAKYDFHISQETLGPALVSLAQQAGVQLLYPYDVAWTPGIRPVVGRYTVSEALDQLLQDTGFSGGLTTGGVITVSRRAISPAKSDCKEGEAMSHGGKKAASVLAFLVGVSAAGDCRAQADANQAAGPVKIEEVIVSARKRDETSIAVPVTLTAVSSQELERRALNNIDDVARVTPQLLTGEAGGIIGGNIAIRGFSGTDANPFGEQAVAFNIDGIEVARATVRRLSEMDLAQVEVLKGPQALFYGKNSPAGIISVHSADPTSQFESKLSLGYDVVGDEVRGDGYIAGPITDDLGYRVAVYGSNIGGWLDNVVPSTSPIAPHDKTLPSGHEIAFRTTLKYDPGTRFNARLKVSFDSGVNSGIQSSSELIYCPLGTPQAGDPGLQCHTGGTIVRGDLGPLFGRINSRFGDGVPYLHLNQWLSSLEMNYSLTDALKLTSVTGVYDVSSHVLENYSNTAVPARIFASAGRYHVLETSQEFRLTSNFASPINFMVGSNLQDSKLANGTVTAVNATTPTLANEYYLAQDGFAYSFFGQLSAKPFDVLEITGGGRYSSESKDLTQLWRFGAAVANPFPRHDSWHNFSPEFTVSYRPTQTLTIYADYKRGFLSGGFNAGASNFATDLRYGQETIRGFEGGIKALLLDGRLRTNLSAYKYDIYGLQVTILTNNSFQTIANAGKANQKGGEFDVNYLTPLEGLTLRGAAAYNRTRYDQFSVGCYRGQTQAQGCNVGIINGVGTLQSLAGQTAARAPAWSGNLGFVYEQNLTDRYKIGLSTDLSFSSSYVTDATNKPNTQQHSYQLLDATIRLNDEKAKWEFAVIGKNLTNVYYFSRSSDVPFTGTAPGGTTGTLGDSFGIVNRGREVMFRISKKFGG